MRNKYGIDYSFSACRVRYFLCISEEFMEIASKKWYYNRKFFWYFLFGIAGYLIVIALPTKEECVHKKGFSVENNTIDKHKDKNDK